MDELTTPAPDSFEVDGVTYTKSDDIAITRYRALQKWETEFGFDGSFRGQYENALAIRKAIDERKSISDIAYLNETTLRGIAAVDRNEIYQLQVVALWFNGPDEDPASYVYADIAAKINRWEAAGLGVGFFFAKAANCVRGFRQAWLQSYPAQGPSHAAPSLPMP